jgi:hypothetical protein
MTFTGHIQNGQVVFDAPVPLPDGTEVRVTPAEPPAALADRPKTLAERWAGIAGMTVDLPEDAAAQHDHYLYGTPKR